MDDPELESGYRSIRALGRAVLALGAATLGSMMVLGDPLVDELLPWFLGGAAILLGLGVWRIDARPKARWRGMAASAVLLGVFVLLRHGGLVV